MHTLVLVGGSFMAARCWNPVVDAAHRDDVQSRVVELAGLGERANVRNDDITLGDHADDVLQTLRAVDTPMTLVAHSYAGVPALIAADRYLRDHQDTRGLASLRQAVLVGAMVPEPGISVFSTMPPEAAEYLRDLAHRVGDGAIPVMTDDQLDGWGDHGMTTADRARFREVTSPHPVGTYEQRCPADLDAARSLPQTYVRLTGDSTPPPDSFVGRVVHFDSGHWPMITRPRELASLLIDIATHPARPA